MKNIYNNSFHFVRKLSDLKTIYFPNYRYVRGIYLQHHKSIKSVRLFDSSNVMIFDMPGSCLSRVEIGTCKLTILFQTEVPVDTTRVPLNISAPSLLIEFDDQSDLKGDIGMILFDAETPKIKE